MANKIKLCFFQFALLIIMITAFKENSPAFSESAFSEITSKWAIDSLPAGFEGIRFSSRQLYSPDEPYYRFEDEDKENNTCCVYIPADMSGSVFIHMKSSLTMEIEGIGFYESGDLFPLLREDYPYLLKLSDHNKGEEICSANTFFYYTSTVPSMYIHVSEEAFKEVNSDKKHNAAANASFYVYKKDGSLDSFGECSIKGRGNSTWSQKKKPYNINLKKQQVILDMYGCRKYALIANYWDSTQMRQMIAYKTASLIGLEFTPETAYVNLYINGQFYGLYLLTQRLKVDGGTVEISDLDVENKNANRNVEENDLDTKILDEDVKGNKAIAFLWPSEPANITGGYLLEMDNRYAKEESWFRTESRHIVIKSPEKPSVGEFTYISSYVREAEKALLSEDGINPETNKFCFAYFDLNSWARMYLIQEFFIQADDELYSFYFYKKQDDPLIYCGPVWDFDQCLGTMNYGDYYKTFAHTMWLRDSRKRWLNRMDQYPKFREKVKTLFLEEFEPAIRDLLEKNYEQTVTWLEKDTKLNYRRWDKERDFLERTSTVKELILERIDFFHDYYCNTEKYHRLLFQFEWGDLSYYIRDGHSMGFIPSSEYGENQSSSQIEKNGLIVGWKTIDGFDLKADTQIYQDFDLIPKYQ